VLSVAYVISFLGMIVLPILLGIYLARKFKLSWKPLLAGALTFIASQVLHIPFLYGLTAAFKNGGGLISETDMDTTEVQLRRPDIAFYSGEQISRMKPGENQVAPWLAEVISPTDNADKINELDI